MSQRQVPPALLVAGTVAALACADGAGPPSGPDLLTVVAHQGTDQVAIGHTAVAVAPAVRITDAKGPREGVQVEFTVLRGGGQVTEHVASTDADGIARVGSWQLGPSGAAQQLNARVGLANTSIIFEAEAITGPYHRLEPIFEPRYSEDYDLEADVFPPIRVIATDVGGNPVAGVPVTWQVVQGSGTLTGSDLVTGVNGIASGGTWRLGTVAGPYRVEVTPGVPGSLSPGFSVRTRPGPATTIEALTPVQLVAAPGTNVMTPPRIRVRDHYGNLVKDRQAIFTVVEGGGSVDNTHQILDANGTAGVMRWTLGPTPGAHRLTVRVDQVTATFTATANP